MADQLAQRLIDARHRLIVLSQFGATAWRIGQEGRHVHILGIVLHWRLTDMALRQIAEWVRLVQIAGDRAAAAMRVDRAKIQEERLGRFLRDEWPALVGQGDWTTGILR